MAAFVERVAEQATTVRPLKVLLTLLAVPFYVVGWVLGLLWVAVLFAVGAVKVGIADARERAHRTPTPDVPVEVDG
ncbi:MAG: hypothetical protein RL134_614 [Actinomycetota bacterium]|jgi:hypothetical protein